MGLNNNYSDYGSASSSNSGSPWGSMEGWPLSASVLEPLRSGPPVQRSNSLADGNIGAEGASNMHASRNSRSTFDVMEEFKMNGFDSPYEPEEDQLWGRLPHRLSGMGPPAGYLRQKSWPEPERTPAAPLPHRVLRTAPDLQDWPDSAPKMMPTSSGFDWPDSAAQLPVSSHFDWTDVTPKTAPVSSDWTQNTAQKTRSASNGLIDWSEYAPKTKSAPCGLQDWSQAALKTRPAPNRLADWSDVSPKPRPTSMASGGLEKWSDLARELSTLSMQGGGTEMEWADLAAPIPQWSDEEAGSVPPSSEVAAITAEQLRVLQSLPNVVLFAILRDLQQYRQEKRGSGKRRLPDECRFCKNNGERESYYRSHVLKEADGTVSCPVLRAFVCRRCGASGDTAHTIKYCPLSTEEERNQSSAMMRSVRMASGRRRTSPVPPSSDAPANHQPTTTTDAPAGGEPWNLQPLGPEWAALEQKLML